MESELIEYKQRMTKKKIGDVLVRYGALIIKCELAYHSKAKKAWIRMPEYWLTQDYKHVFVSWIAKEISDEFQETMLNKIFNRYDLDVHKLAELHAHANKRKV